MDFKTAEYELCEHIISIENGIKNKAFTGLGGMFDDMEEGDLLQFRGGLGNNEIVGIKKENGIYYRRDFVGEWHEFDPYKRLAEMALNRVIVAE